MSLVGGKEMIKNALKPLWLVFPNIRLERQYHSTWEEEIKDFELFSRDQAWLYRVDENYLGIHGDYI